MADIQVLHMPDCTTLAHCLRESLQSDLYKYSVRLKDFAVSIQVPDDDDDIALVVVLIVSPESFTLLRSKPHRRRTLIMSSIFPDKSTGVLVFTGVTEKEFTDAGIDEDFPKYSRLRKFSESQNINKLSDMLEKCCIISLEDSNCYQCLPSPVAVCHVYPDTIFSTDQQVLLVFSEESTDAATMAIELDGKRLSTAVKRLNPNSCTFTIPSIYSYGCKTLTLWKEDTGELIGRCRIEVIPSSEAVGRLLQSCLNTEDVFDHVSKSVPLETVNSSGRTSIISRGSSCPDSILESFGGTSTSRNTRGNRGSTHSTSSGSSTSSDRRVGHGNRMSSSSDPCGYSSSRVDETMTQIFAESVVGETRDYRVSDQASINMTTSSYVLPTWLHFAARYGMRKLANEIINSPITDDSLFIVNADGDLTDALARKYGHPELAETLRERLAASEVDRLYETPVISHFESTLEQEEYMNFRDSQKSMDSGVYSTIGDNGDMRGNDGSAYVNMSQVQHKPHMPHRPATSERGDKSNRRISAESLTSIDSGCSMSEKSPMNRSLPDMCPGMRCSGAPHVNSTNIPFQTITEEEEHSSHYVKTSTLKGQHVHETSRRSGQRQLEITQQRGDTRSSGDDERMLMLRKQASDRKDHDHKKSGTFFSKIFGKKSKDSHGGGKMGQSKTMAQRGSECAVTSLANAQLGRHTYKRRGSTPN